MSGETSETIWNKMSYAEGLQFDQIYWLDRNERRQLCAVNKAAEIEVVQPYEETQSGVI
jgi:hypothetical protein